MSKLTSNTRQHLISRKLQSVQRMTFAEINNYLREQSDVLDKDITVSIRTFQRDIQEIGTLYGIYIEYNRSGKYYYIKEELEPETNERLFEAFDVYNALRIGEQNLQHVFLEKRQAQGTQHLFGLLHAIKNRVRISFEYQKYYRDHVSKRTVAPLALKEFKNRWYLFARDYHDGRVKTYALDRMANLEFLKTKFPKIDFDLSQMLKHCFGIIVPSDEKPQKIILSFNQFQGKYIKSLPLHETQEILIDNDNELRISLNIYPTHDFKMEILSLGENVKVLEPKNFVKEVKDSYSKALKQY